MSLIGASVLALVTTSLDRRLAGGPLFEELFSRNPEAMRSALSVVASSILTFTALVFSVTMLVVQQASNQLSPRVVQAFLEDRTSQYALGTFLGTFAYTLLVLRDIRSPVEGVGFVPGMSVALVFVAVLASLTTFVAHLNHVTESIKVDVVADRILADTRHALDRAYPRGGDVEPDPGPAVHRDSRDVVQWTDRPGVIQDLDVDALREHAAAGGSPLVVVPATGSYVRPGDGHAGRGERSGRPRRPAGGVPRRPDTLTPDGRRLRLPPARRHRDPRAVAGNQRPDDRRAGHRPHSRPPGRAGHASDPTAGPRRRRRGAGRSAGGRAGTTTSTSRCWRSATSAPGQSSRFILEGEPALLEDVTVADTDGGSVVRFTFVDRLPAVRVERVEPPITEAPSGRPLELAGTSFLAVEMVAASRGDLSGDDGPRQTYDGPTSLTPDADGVAAVALTEDDAGRMSWVVGTREPRDFAFRIDGQSVEVLPSPQE